MADDDKKDEQELSEDEKLAAEWEAAMEESGDDADSGEDEGAAAMADAGENGKDDEVPAGAMAECDHGREPAQGGGQGPATDSLLVLMLYCAPERR